MADEPVLENARPVCHRPLPAVRPEDEALGSILLFYQYVEPVWTKSGALDCRASGTSRGSHDERKLTSDVCAKNIKKSRLMDRLQSTSAPSGR